MYAVVWVHGVGGVSAGVSGHMACLHLLSEGPLVIRRSVPNRLIRQLYIRIGRDTTFAQSFRRHYGLPGKVVTECVCVAQPISSRSSIRVI